MRLITNVSRFLDVVCIVCHFSWWKHTARLAIKLKLRKKLVYIQNWELSYYGDFHCTTLWRGCHIWKVLIFMLLPCEVYTFIIIGFNLPLFHRNFLFSTSHYYQVFTQQKLREEMDNIYNNKNALQIILLCIV